VVSSSGPTGDGASLKISVVICTYNRADALPSAILSVLRQSVPPERFEVIVVDNNSTDDTASVVKPMMAEHDNLRYVFEARQGTSIARNRGWREARAPYVAYIDDDAEATAAWLGAVMEALATSSPKPVALGGPILPLYRVPKPKWFKDEWETATWGPEPRFLEGHELLHGSNMVVSRSALERVGGFCESLGPVGATYAQGEDTELFFRLQADSQGHIYYTPDAVVRHEVATHKMSVRYRMWRSFGSGQAWYEFRRPRSRPQRALLVAKEMGRIGLLLVRAVPIAYRCAYVRRWAVQTACPIMKALGRAYAAIRDSGTQRGAA